MCGACSHLQRGCVLVCVETYVGGVIMSHYLKKFKRPKPDAKKDSFITVRLSKDLRELFSIHCEDLGLGISEACVLLILNELGSVDAPQGNTPIHNDVVQEVATTLEVEHKPYIKVTQCNISSKKKSSGSRFSIDPYSIGNMTACPLCEAMTSRSNYARHLKKDHNYFEGTKQFINEHMAKVLEVLEREKEK